MLVVNVGGERKTHRLMIGATSNRRILGAGKRDYSYDECEKT